MFLDCVWPKFFEILLFVFLKINSMSFSLLYVTHPSKPEAVRVTVALMNARLIACANYYPMDSVYWWEWRLTSATEIMTIYKTRTEHIREVEAMIISLHKYETPCIIRLAEVTANAPFEEWIQGETDRTKGTDPIPQKDDFDRLF